MRVKLERTSYCGSPCFRFRSGEGRMFIDLDWNCRFPFGFSLWMRFPAEHPAVSCCLELNPPLGEPNRLYVTAGIWHVIAGLPSVRGSRDTGEVYHGLPVYRKCLTWLHVDGIERYHYRRDETGEWVRNPLPEKWHWNWLTIRRRTADEEHDDG